MTDTDAENSDTVTDSRESPAVVLADTLWSCFMIWPLTVLHWSGTWMLLDIYIDVNNHELSAWISLAVGFVANLLAYILLPLIGGHVQVSCNVKHIIISRIFLYIYAATGTVCSWRGFWYLSDIYVGRSKTHSAILVSAAVVCLVLLRVISNCLAPPFLVIHDTRKDFYKTIPRFRTEVSRPLVYCIDGLFTSIFVNLLTICTWSGLWNLFDALILPADLLWSYTYSLISGLGLCLLILAMQPAADLAVQSLRRYGTVTSLALEDLCKCVAVVSHLLLWRGGWGMMKDYVMSGKAADAWLYHGLGVAGLLAVQVASVVATAGCAVDGEAAARGSSMLKIQYFGVFWRTINAGRRDLLIQDEERRPLLTEQPTETTSQSPNSLG